MLDLRTVTDHLDEVRTALTKRSAAAAESLDRVAELAAERRAAIAAAESKQQARNEASKAMGKIADKKSEEFAQKRADLKALSDEVKSLEARQKQIQAEVEELLLGIPNTPAPEVPAGSDEDANVVLRTVGEAPRFDFEPKDHVDLGLSLGIFDAERGVKISGSRFAVLKGLGARLERALMSFMLDLHTDKHGYTEMWPPAIVNDRALRGTGQLPKFADDAFRLEHGAKDAEGNHTGSLYLSPTAEVQLTNLHADEILDAEQLPIRYTAYTPCFRAEAGSAGKDTRGFMRMHQFDKVELVHLATPEQAVALHEELTAHAEQVLKLLGLHYRVVDLCGGDLGFSAHRTFDLEVWLPGQQRFREISSCSWFGDYQARRAKLRFRPGPKQKPQFVHTLNGSALAVGRTWIAVLENYQQADGSIRVPEVLKPYLGGLDVLRPA